MLATLAVGQHAVREGKSIYVPTWTRLQVDESIPVQKWNGQVHYTDTAAGASIDRGRRFLAL